MNYSNRTGDGSSLFCCQPLVLPSTLIPQASAEVLRRLRYPARSRGSPHCVASMDWQYISLYSAIHITNRNKMITNTMNPTTIIASVQPKMFSQVTEQLSHIQGITFYSPVTGRFDLAIELKAADPTQVYELVNRVRSIAGVTSTRTCTPFEGFVNGKNVQPTDTLALVLLNVNENAQKVLRSLAQYSQ